MSLPHLNDRGPREIFDGKNSTAAMVSVPVEKHAHPTVLVAVEDEVLRSGLVSNLRQLGCLVLEAEMAVRAIEVVISHSRPIHVLVIDKDLDDVGLMGTLRPYRPQMNILLVRAVSNRGEPDALAVDAALVKIKELLDLPRRRAAAR